jgi:hypothetical protein
MIMLRARDHREDRMKEDLREKADRLMTVRVRDHREGRMKEDPQEKVIRVRDHREDRMKEDPQEKAIKARDPQEEAIKARDPQEEAIKARDPQVEAIKVRDPQEEAIKAKDPQEKADLLMAAKEVRVVITDLPDKDPVILVIADLKMLVRTKMTSRDITGHRELKKAKDLAESARILISRSSIRR